MGLLSTAAKAQLDSGIAPLAFFAELSFTGATERYWSGLHEITWDGQTWTPTGKLGGASPMESSEDFRANGMTLSVAGLPSSTFSNFQALTADAYKGRAARFVVAIMAEDFGSVLHPIERHFTIDLVDYTLDPDLGGVVTVSLETDVRRASRAMVRRYTPQDQEKDWPGDKAFEFVPYINSGVDVKWGRGGSFFPPN